MMQRHFRAPWSPRLKMTTAVVLGILLIASFAAPGVGQVAALALVVACLAFSVRGYSLVGDQLLIHHLGWATRFDLSTLERAEVFPGATMGSVRIWGIGGFFAFVGSFRNALLGAYQAYATDEANTVVLDFGGKIIVVTPEAPEDFVAAIQALRPT